MNKLVSVIVPVYNVEKYLDRCVESIVNQSYTNIELILVNDGSTDSSAEICDGWAAKDNRIRVIHKENAGAGQARNTGIDNATGEYVFFFDSDDYVDLHTVEKAYKLAEDEATDIVVFGMSGVDRNGNIVNSRTPVASQTSFEGDEVQRDFLPALTNWQGNTEKVKNICLSACSCIFSMDLINRANWRFVSEREIISEDTFSLLMLYKYVKKVSILSETLYFYFENVSSFSRSYSTERFERLKHFYIKCVELCGECNYPPEVAKGCRSPFIGNVLGVLKKEVAFCKTRKKSLKGIKMIVNDELVQSTLREIKKDKLVVKLKIRVLFWTMRHKRYNLCYFLLYAQNASLR